MEWWRLSCRWGTVVEVMMANRNTDRGVASGFYWLHFGLGADIIKYRIMSDSERDLEQSNTKPQVEPENALENAVYCLIALCKTNQIDVSISKDGKAVAHTSFGDFGLKNKSSQDVAKLLECIKFVNDF